jgi:hypothetical protein
LLFCILLSSNGRTATFWWDFLLLVFTLSPGKYMNVALVATPHPEINAANTTGATNDIFI